MPVSGTRTATSISARIAARLIVFSLPSLIGFTFRRPAQSCRKNKRPLGALRLRSDLLSVRSAHQRGTTDACYIESLLSRSWSISSLTSTSTTLPSLTITVSRPKRRSFRRARGSSTSIDSRSLTYGGRPLTELGLSIRHRPPLTYSENAVFPWLLGCCLRRVRFLSLQAAFSRSRRARCFRSHVKVEPL